jgi:LAO/AO transport system kinase
MEKTKPEWAPKESGSEFASNVMSGIDLDSIISAKEKKARKPKRPAMSVSDYVKGILNKDLTAISRAITLLESNNSKHIEQTQQVLQEILPHSGKSIRIGITGSPGAGKSTFIEALGTFLCKNGHKVAVLAIDPSSTMTRGSILGDKTRMELLSREPNAFIRPSPSGGTLGGVARKTRETILVCEAAGYDVILIETIGVGQSEITVRSMVDCFLLMLLPGAGDELQGIKKGVVEIADLLVVNKAEGDFIHKANITKTSYSAALQLLQPATQGWKTRVLTCSALHQTGIDNVWSNVNEFIINTQSTGEFESRRKNQFLEWFDSMLEEGIKNIFFSELGNRQIIERYKEQVLSEKITPTRAVNEILEEYKK